MMQRQLWIAGCIGVVVNVDATAAKIDTAAARVFKSMNGLPNQASGG